MDPSSVPRPAADSVPPRRHSDLFGWHGVFPGKPGHPEVQERVSGPHSGAHPRGPGAARAVSGFPPRLGGPRPSLPLGPALEPRARAGLGTAEQRGAPPPCSGPGGREEGSHRGRVGLLGGGAAALRARGAPRPGLSAAGGGGGHGRGQPPLARPPPRALGDPAAGPGPWGRRDSFLPASRPPRRGSGRTFERFCFLCGRLFLFSRDLTHPVLWAWR